jgi:hypothetical protein
MIFVLIFISYVYNGGLVASELSEGSNKSFLISSTWPQPLQDLLRLELIYGDRQINKREAQYIINAIFQAKGRPSKSSFVNDIRSLATLLTILPTESNVLKTCASQISSQTTYSEDEIQKLIENELGKNQTSFASVAPLCEEIVSKGGKITLRNEKMSGRIFYQLTKTQGITPEIYNSLVTDNPSIVSYILDSLRFIREPDEYVLSIANLVTKESGWEKEKLQLVELTEYMNISGGHDLLRMVYDTIPSQIDESGKITYKVGIGTSPDIILRASSFAERHLLFRDKYLNAKNSSDRLLDFFSENTLPGKQKEDKSWLLYRYHSDLIMPLVKQYSEYTTPAVYDEELKIVLSGVLSYGEIFQEYTPFLTDVKSLIKKMALEKGDSVHRVNGLYLLEVFVSESDIPSLKDLVYDETNVTWKEQKIKTHSGPLIAYCAINCLKKIDCARSKTTLTEIAQDEKLDARIRKNASQALKFK